MTDVFLNTSDLIKAQRNVPESFQITLNSGVLECDKLLRVLPGKRIVCRATWQGEKVLAKIYLSDRANAHITREVTGLQLLLDVKLPAPQIITTCTVQDEIAQVLLLQYFPDATDFSIRWNHATDQQQIALLKRIVVLIATMHAKGFKQEDAHLDNFLLQCEHGGDDKLILIDGADIKAISAPDKSIQIENLALFFAQFPHKNDIHIPDLFTLYCKTIGWRLNAALAAQLLQQTYLKRRYRNKKFVEKSFLNSTQFIKQQNWHYRMICQRAYYNTDFKALLKNLDAAIAGGVILKNGNSATVAKVTCGKLELVIKRYNIKNITHRLRRAFRPSRAATSWANAHRLNHCGIKTPEAIAILEQRIGPLRSKAYIINLYVAGVSATQFFNDNNQAAKPNSSVIQQFKDVFAAMDNIMVSHGDFKASNFIVHDNQVMMIDLDSMQQHQNQNKFRSAFNKDLARFKRNWDNKPKIKAAFIKAGVFN